MKKKYTSLIAVSLIVALLLTTAASASFIDGLQYFVTEGYQGREQLLGFFMIFLIFFSVLFGALQKTTFKDQKNASIVIAFCVALISAISIISQIEFSISGFRYIAEGLFFLLLVILIYSLLVKIGMEKNKFFAFILAILIAAFLIFLVNRLIEEGPGNMFEGLGSDLNFGGVGFGREKAKKSLTPEELEDLKLQWVEENLVKKSIEKELNKLKGDIQTTTDPEKYRSIRNELRSKRSESKSSTKRIKDIHNDLEDNNVPEEELAGLMPVEPTPKKGSNIIWIILVVALTLTGAGIFAVNKLRKERGPGTTTTEEKLIEDIEKTFKAKKDVIKRIEVIENHIGKDDAKMKATIDRFNKIKAGIEKESIYNIDPESARRKGIENEINLIKPLINDKVDLERELIDLYKKEEELIGEIKKEEGILGRIFSKLIPATNIDIPRIMDSLQKDEANKLLAEIKKLETLIPEIQKNIKELYGLVGIEIKEIKDLEKLLTEDQNKRKEEMWDILKKKEEGQLMPHFNKEKATFKELDGKLREQITIIEGMRDYLNEIIRKEKEIAKEEEKAKEEVKKKEEIGKVIEALKKIKQKKEGEEAATPRAEVKPAEKPKTVESGPTGTSGKSKEYNLLLELWQKGEIDEKRLQELKNNVAEGNESVKKDISDLLEDIKNKRVHKTK